MKEYKHGLEKLAQEIENHLDPIGTPFECRTMAEYISENRFSFQNLSYKQMRRFLVRYGVLTDEEQSQIDSVHNDEKYQSSLIFHYIVNSLYANRTSRLKSFLELLEEDDDPDLKEVAERLGGSKRVPPDPTQIKQECRDEEALGDTESGTVGNFKELYYQAVNDLGSEELQLCKVVIFGPPGVGKSSLCKVLIKPSDVKQESEQSSTDILDIKLVQFTVEVTKDEKKGKSVWNIVTLEKEIERLRHVIEEKLYNRNALQQISYDEVQQKQPSLEDAALPNIEKNENIHEVVCQSLPESPTEEQKTYWKTSNIFIALYDSGGQPEFFDVMPLLNTLPTGNIMVFNMNQPVDAKISPELYEQGHCMFTGKETHYTNAELMKTALANIESCITKQSISHDNKVLVVGTHLDKYVEGKENVEESLSQLDDTLSKAVLSDSTRGMLVYYCREGKEDRIVHPISNINCDKEQNKVAQKIRTAIEEMSKSANIRKEIPNSWLLFQYQIRLLKKPCVRLSDCQDIAKGVRMKEDVKVVLKYFHDLGILLNYKELGDVVFCDPQWLFKQLSALIRAKYNKAYSADVENGIVNTKFLAKSIYSNLEKDTDDIIKLKDLIKLFVSLYIVAKLPEKESENLPVEEPEEWYFMPALLNPAPQNLSLSEFGKTFYDTMYVIYKGTLFPRGMFCCLLTLFTKKQKMFKILENNMHKNLIVFQIITDKNESQNYLILSDKINYITVELYQQNQYNLLQEIYCEFIEALQEVCKKMRLNYQFQFGFACQEKSCKEKNSKKGTTTVAVVDLKHNFCPKIMCCKGCSKSVTLEYNQLLWFVPLQVLDVLQRVHSRGSNDSSSKHKKRKTDMKEPTPASGGDSGNVIDNVSVKDDDDGDDDDGVIEEPCLSNKDKDDVIVDELWKEEELRNMGYQKNKICDLPDAQKSNVLDKVLLLLLTVNNIEDNAALCYLEPLPGHNKIFRYWQRDDAGVHAEHAIYRIGIYGACPAAVRQIKAGSEIGGATTAPTLAFRCFKNLNAIIGMGVACGVEKKTKLCDVLVADKVNNYDMARLEKGGILNRGLALPTSSLLSEIFRQRIMWPDDEIKERLDKYKMKPKIKQGVILSGPYLIDNKKIKKDLIQNFASEAIGIEMEAAYLFRAAQQVPTHMTIVKAVCDFGDGKKNKYFQPTAALLAANCVKRYLDEGAVKMLQRESHNKGEDDQDYTSPNNERYQELLLLITVEVIGTIVVVGII